ncbi:MAG: serine/threonine-protein kinase [Thermogemmata sp.]|nr:serine/threonine-protein kinase [Thermogemmata sp.]
MEQTRYRLIRRIGRGGMGEVWLADDLTLNRKVAIKFALVPQSSWRFEQEVAITALLQHPGIVPVYTGGCQKGIRYYVMRYVEGQRFDQAIAEFHRLLHRPSDFARRQIRLAFLELIHRFLAVCRTIAYAHSQGIIHRDLKPTNIILGQFGETIVLDWGLARRINCSEQSQSDSSTLSTPHQVTRTGAQIGTPAYMAPEQRLGLPADQRTDVFLLGATLYHLLTGQVPFTGQTAAFAPCFTQRWLPRALQAICSKAMQPEAADRYDSVEALAADIESWLADQNVAAYDEPMHERLLRWIRRHRLAATSVAAMLAAALPLLIFFSAALAAKNRQLLASNTDLEISLSREEAARREAQYNLQVAEEARLIAEERRRKVQQTILRLRQVLNLITSDEVIDFISRRKELTAENRQLLEAIVAYHQQSIEELSVSEQDKHQHAITFGRIGRLLHILGRPDQSLQALQLACKLFEQLVAKHPDEPQHRHELAKCHVNLAYLLQFLGRFQEAHDAYQQALHLLVKLAAEHPQNLEYRKDLAATHLNLAVLLRDLGRFQEAHDAYQQAIVLREKLVTERPRNPDYRRDLATTYVNFAVLLQSIERFQEAHRAFERGVHLLENLAAEHPQIPVYRKDLAASYINFANLLQDLGRLQEAVQFSTQALELLQKLVAERAEIPEYRKDLASVYNNLAILFKELKRFQEAHYAYQQAIHLQEKLVAEYPQIPEHRQKLARTFLSMGIFLRTNGRFQEAHRVYQQALHVQEKLAAQHPQIPEYRQDLASTYNNLAALLQSMGRFHQARDAYQQSINLRKKLVAEHPQNPAYRQKLASTYSNIGVVLQTLGDLQEAYRAQEQALHIQEKLVAEHPQYPAYCHELANTHNNLGLLLRRLGKPKEAEQAYRQAILLREKLAREHPQFLQNSLNLIKIYINLGNLLNDSERLNESEQVYRQASEILEKLIIESSDVILDVYHMLSVTRSQLASVLARRGQIKESERIIMSAIECCRSACNKYPGDVLMRFELANNLNMLGAILAIQKRDKDAYIAWVDAYNIMQSIIKEGHKSSEFNSLLKQLELQLKNTKNTKNP